MSPRGWPRGLVHNLQIHKQGSTIEVQDLPSKVFFSYESLNVQSQENSYQRATYEDKVPTFH